MGTRAHAVVLSGAFFCAVTVGYAVSVGQLLNPSFDLPDEDRVTEWFTPPLHWDWHDTANNLNYVGLHTDFTPQPEQGQAVHWSIPGPVKGQYFALLSTGDARGPGSSRDTLYSSIVQTITLCPNDRISGHYFFGTCDYLPYDDSAVIKLIPTDPNRVDRTLKRPIILAEISVKDVGNYKSTDGWQQFHYQFDYHECVEFYLYCEATDTQDRIYKSYLALDGFRICRNVPDFGDFNLDCAIDYHDFDIFARTWLADCNDPNVIADPNIPCNLVITDPNMIYSDPNCPSYDPDAGVIGLEQLMLFKEHWLERFD